MIARAFCIRKPSGYDVDRQTQMWMDSRDATVTAWDATGVRQRSSVVNQDYAGLPQIAMTVQSAL